MAVKFLKEAPSYQDYQLLMGSYATEYGEWSGVIGEAWALGLGPQDILDYLGIVRRHKGV